jgi:hypothetical protein
MKGHLALVNLSNTVQCAILQSEIKLNMCVCMCVRPFIITAVAVKLELDSTRFACKCEIIISLGNPRVKKYFPSTKPSPPSSQSVHRNLYKGVRPFLCYLVSSSSHLLSSTCAFALPRSHRKDPHIAHTNASVSISILEIRGRTLQSTPSARSQKVQVRTKETKIIPLAV